MPKRQDIWGVEINGDITGLKKAMDEAGRVAKSAERSLKTINKALQLDPSNDKLIEKQANSYRQSIEEYQKYLRELQRLRRELERNPNTTDETLLKEQATNLDLEIQKVKKTLKELREGFKNIKGAEFEKLQIKVQKLYETMGKFKEVTDTLKASLEGIDKQIELDPSNIDNYVKRQELLKQAIKTTTAQVEEYKKRLESLRSERGYSQKIEETTKEFAELSTEIAQAQVDIERYNQQLQWTPQQEQFMDKMGRLSETFLTISENTRMLSRVFQGLLTASFNSYKSMESDIANIKRVVNDLRDSTIEDLKDIAVQSGTTFTEVAEYANIAGALGLAEQDISRFAKTMIDLNTATGGVFSGEEGAKGIAVFLKQLNLGIDQAENFGSAIAVIGDRYADIGDETVNVATKLTGLNSIIKTNQYELIGLSGVMADLGLSADTNANAINRAFLQIDKALVDTSKNAQKKMDALAKTSGMTAEEFKKAWGENAMEAFLRFTDGLKTSVFNEVNDAISTSNEKVEEFASLLNMSAEQFKEAWAQDSKGIFDQYIEALGELGDEGVVASKILSDLGISSVNTAQTLLRLSGSGNEVRKAIALTNDAWNKNTALQEKAGIIYETTERKLQGLFEALKQLGATIIDEFAPTIKELIENFTDIVRAMNDMSPAMKKLVAIFMTFGASISPVTRGLGLMLSGFQKNDKGIYKFVERANLLKDTLFTPTGLIAGIVGFSAVLGKIGWDNYNAKIEEMTGDTQRLLDSYNNLSNSISETTAQFQLEQSMLEVRAEKVDGLLEKISQLDKAEQESIDTKREIANILDDLNDSLGENKFFYDEAKNAIVNEKGEVIELTELYPQLAQERRKSYYLEQYQSLYEEALRNEKELILEKLSLERQFQNELSNQKSVVKDAWAEYDNLSSAGKQAYLSKLEETDAYTYNAIKNLDALNLNIESTQTTLDLQEQKVRTFIESYDELGQAEGNAIDLTIQKMEIQNRHLEEGALSLDELREKYQEYYDYLNNPDIYQYQEDMKAYFEEELAYYEEQISLIENAQKKTEERYKKEEELMGKHKENTEKLLYDEKEGIVYKHERASARVNKAWKDSFGKASEYLKTTFESALESVRASASAGVDLPVRLQWSGGFGAIGELMSRQTWHQNSGGYDNLKSMMDSNLNSGGYNVSNYNSGGIKVYNSFTISNGQNVTTSVLKDWAMQIVDVINLELGNAI